MAPLIIHKLQDLHKSPPAPIPRSRASRQPRPRILPQIHRSRRPLARRRRRRRRRCQPGSEAAAAAPPEVPSTSTPWSPLLVGAQGRACKACLCPSPHPTSHHNHGSRWCRQDLPAPHRVQALHQRHPVRPSIQHKIKILHFNLTTEEEATLLYYELHQSAHKN